jgi:hypothetical protein
MNVRRKSSRHPKLSPSERARKERGCPLHFVDVHEPAKGFEGRHGLREALRIPWVFEVEPVSLGPLLLDEASEGCLAALARSEECHGRVSGEECADCGHFGRAIEDLHDPRNTDVRRQDFQDRWSGECAAD